MCTPEGTRVTAPLCGTLWNESGIFDIISVEDRREAKAVILMPPQLFEAAKMIVVLRALRFLAPIHRNGSIFFFILSGGAPPSFSHYGMLLVMP